MIRPTSLEERKKKENKKELVYFGPKRTGPRTRTRTRPRTGPRTEEDLSDLKVFTDERYHDVTTETLMFMKEKKPRLTDVRTTRTTDRKT